MTRYEQGFLTKCAEYGIDGRELLKQAGLLSNTLRYGKSGLRAVKNLFTRGGEMFTSAGTPVSKEAITEAANVLKQAIKNKANNYGKQVYDTSKKVLKNFDPRTTKGIVNSVLAGTGIGAIGVAHSRGKKLDEIHQAYGF